MRTLRKPPALITMVVLFGLVLSACGGTDSTADGAAPSATATVAPTATTDPAPTPRPPEATPTALPLDAGDSTDGSTDGGSTDGGSPGGSTDGDTGDQASGGAEGDATGGGTGDGGPTPTPTAATTVTPPPIPTAAPTATAVPAPTSTPAPAPTPVPTATPHPTATPAPVVRPIVACSITPQRDVAVNEALVFTATSSPSTMPVSFTFDHGDGTLDRTPRSDAYFAAPGKYRVRLGWATEVHDGTEDCGIVTVVNGSGCWIGLGPADGLGWWCGSVFCPSGSSLAQCPAEAPWGCYTTMAGSRQCIPRGTTDPVCLVGQGPADGFAWYCDGVWCNPDAPHTGCPPYPIYGCHATVSGPTICIDPAPEPVMSCTISDTTIAVNEVVTFRAVQSGIDVPVDVVFGHGDGTIDPRRVAQAYYTAPGSYVVTMQWSWANGGGTVVCGTVTVT